MKPSNRSQRHDPAPARGQQAFARQKRSGGAQRPLTSLCLLVAFAALLASTSSWAQVSGGPIHPGGGGITRAQADGRYLRIDGGNDMLAPLDLEGAAQTLCSAALSLRFANDTNTGMQRAAADTISWCLGGAATLTMAAGAWTLPVDTNVTLTGGVNGFSLDGTTFSVDGASNRIGIGTAAPSHVLSLVDASLSEGESAFHTTATMPSSADAQYATQIVATGGGSGAGGQNALYVTLTPGGYTGTSATRTLYFNNANLNGGGTTAISDAGNANYGVAGLSLSAHGGARSSVGLLGYGAQAGDAGLARNFGAIGFSDGTPQADTENIGLYGTAAPAFGVSVGVMATLYGETDTIGTLVDTALLLDNAAVAAPILVARDNGTDVFTLADGGALTHDGGATFNTSNANVNFTVDSDTEEAAFQVAGATTANVALEADGDIALSPSKDLNMIATAAGAHVYLQTLNAASGDITIESNGGHFELVADGEAASVVQSSNHQLQLSAADGIFLTNASDFMLTQSGNEILGHQSVDAAPPRWRIPSIIAASGGILPTCDATNAGNIFYSDDTDDGLRGELCVCTASAGGVYANTVAGTATACPDP